jgi:transglutaminase-like putative cysteine protease
VNRRLAVGIVPMALLVFLAAAQFLGWKASAEGALHPRERTFLFTYQVHVPPSPETQGQTRLWIPLPQSDQHQAIRNLSLATPVAYTRGFDSEYGNSFALLVPTPAQVASGYDATLQFEVTRHEFAKDVNAAIKPGAASATSEKMLRRYLQPDKLVPLNRAIAELAKEKTDGATDPMEKARRIYNYVATTMRYDKSGEGWGRGDEMWACDSKRGNCADFHSVLIGMMRSSGIPARFEIGFPLPQGKTEGEISGYHCWAEFYVNGFGWIPADASEASKNPAKRDYFFGAVDPDRVMFTYGRDIRLSADHKGDPLNYFVYPYAEANGQPVKGLETHFSFRDVSPAGSAAGGGR